MRQQHRGRKIYGNGLTHRQKRIIKQMYAYQHR